MFESTTQIRVRYAETDQMGIVYYGNYATYFEVGRVEAIRQLGYSYKEMEAEGVMLPVVELKAKFLRPAKYDDLLTVTTRIPEMPRHKIVFFSEVHNEQGTLLVKGEVTLFFVDAKTFSRASLPARMEAKLRPFFQANA